VTKVAATDLDVDSALNYEIMSSDYSQAFNVNRLGEISVSKEGKNIIDREHLDHAHITLSLKATDGERVGYSTVHIKILGKGKFPFPSLHTLN
jgi:hypothetical protein